MRRIIRELRRRRVFRVAGLYIVGAWVLIQVAGELVEAWALPDQALRYVWIAAGLGLPLALLFGWRYDVEGGRVIRTASRDPGEEQDTSLAAVDYAVLAALAVIAVAIGLGVISRVADTTVSEPGSIAVLPFENMSGDDANKPFTDGIHDDILTQIAGIGDLKVISRTSVARLDPRMSIREIGSLLGVAAVLEGGVQRSGDQLRVNVQLIDALTDNHLWAKTFDHELSARNIFRIQTEIAESVARELQATLSPRERDKLNRRPTDNLEAYEAYLLGNQAMTLRTVEGLELARAHFSLAIAFDPDYALAYVGEANATMLLNTYGGLPLEYARGRTQELLAQALELDDELGAAYAAIGLSQVRSGNIEEAQQNFRRAIELDPNHAPAYHWYGDSLLNSSRRPDEAISQLLRARELDPLSPVITVTLGEAYNALGRFEDAERVFRKVMEHSPDFPGAYFELGLLHRFARGRADEGMRYHALELRSAPHRPPVSLAYAYLDLGDVERARYWSELSLEVDPRGFWTLAGMIRLYLYLEEPEALADYARRLDAVAPGNNWTIYALMSAGLESEALAISQARFPEILECDGAAVNGRNYFQAFNLSLILERAGKMECAAQLVDAVERVIADMPRLGSFGFGLLDVEIHTRRGHKKLALAALREAIDAGLRGNWWAQAYSLHNAALVEEPEFIAMMEEVRADMAAQLENVRRWEASGEIVFPE